MKNKMWLVFFFTSFFCVVDTQVTFLLIKSASHSMFKFYMNVNTAQHPNFTTRLIVVIIFLFALILVVVEKLCARLWCMCGFSLSLSPSLYHSLVLPFSFSLAFSISHLLFPFYTNVLCMLLVFFYFTSVHCAQTTHNSSSSSSRSSGNMCNV